MLEQVSDITARVAESRATAWLDRICLSVTRIREMRGLPCNTVEDACAGLGVSHILGGSPPSSTVVSLEDPQVVPDSLDHLPRLCGAGLCPSLQPCSCAMFCPSISHAQPAWASPAASWESDPICTDPLLR